ncbi:MAG: hypothetical protein O9327_17770, partial [Polaromonas sp.]|nr:hypothetical protein [Polaromonas sp.]
DFKPEGVEKTFFEGFLQTHDALHFLTDSGPSARCESTGAGSNGGIFIAISNTLKSITIVKIDGYLETPPCATHPKP